MVICLERGADLHIAQLMPLPLTVSGFSEIQPGFTFLVPAHSGSPGQRAIKRVCVCVLVRNCIALQFWSTGIYVLYCKPTSLSLLVTNSSKCVPLTLRFADLIKLAGRMLICPKKTLITSNIVINVLHLTSQVICGKTSKRIERKFTEFYVKVKFSFFCLLVLLYIMFAVMLYFMLYCYHVLVK